MEIFNIRMIQWRITLEGDGANNSGRQKNSWWDWTVKDMKYLGLSQDNVHSRNNISLDWHLSRWTWVSRYQNVSVLYFIGAKDDEVTIAYLQAGCRPNNIVTAVKHRLLIS